MENEIKFIQTQNGITSQTEYNTKITYIDAREYTIGRLKLSYTRVCVINTIKARVKFYSFNTTKRALNAFGVNVDLMY